MNPNARFNVTDSGRQLLGGMRITVYGVPIPQGSKTAFVVKGRAVVTDGKKGPALKEWRRAIALTAGDWLRENGAPAPIDCPVSLTATFFLPRPKSAPKRVVFPSTKPDLDKLARSLGDALSKIAYSDDARVVDLHVRKRFAVNSPPRVEIIVTEATDA